MTEDVGEPPLSKAEMRLRRAEQQRADATKARAEIAAAAEARDANTLRLRALRLAKEAADREQVVPPAAKKPRRKVT